MVKHIMLAAAIRVIETHGSTAAGWASEQAQTLRAAGDLAGSEVFECLRDCVVQLLSRGTVRVPTVH